MKLPIILFIAILLPFFTDAQPSVEWHKAYGGSWQDIVYDIRQTTDGGYIFIGRTTSVDGDIQDNHSSNWDVWVVKINATGTIEWKKCYGGSGVDEASTIFQTTDGGYIFLGTTTSTDGDVTSTHDRGEIWLVKLAADGSITWQKTFGGSKDEFGAQLVVTATGYVLVGTTESNDGDISGNHGYRDVCVIWTDLNGQLIRGKTYGGSNWEHGNSIKQAKNGSYIIAAQSQSADGDLTGNYGGIDCWLINITATGEITWQKNYGGSGDEQSYEIAVTSDGGFIFTGSAGSIDHDLTGLSTSKTWIVKTDAVGTILWQNCVGTAQDGTYHIEQLKNDYYILTGDDWSPNPPAGKLSEVWLLQLYPDGSVRWEKSMGGQKADFGMKIRPTADGGYIAACIAASSDDDLANAGYHGSSDVWIVKLGSTAGIDNMGSDKSVSVYPTVTTGIVNIDIDGQFETLKLVLSNYLGQAVYRGEISKQQNTVDLQNHPAGTYFLQLTNAKGTITKKIIYNP